MNSIARKVAFENRYNAEMIMNILAHWTGITTDQDWDNEKTTYTFEDDGSQIIISGPDVEVIDQPENDE